VFLKTFVMETVGTVGGFFTAYTGVAVFLRATLGWLPDRLGPKRLLPVAIAALACGFLLISRAGSSGEILGAGMLFGAGHGFTFPILFGLTVRRARIAAPPWPSTRPSSMRAFWWVARYWGW